MNKQPFYHEYQVLITTTNGSLPEDLEDKICDFVKNELVKTEYTKREPDILLDTIEVLCGPVEAGDPDDLI